MGSTGLTSSGDGTDVERLKGVLHRWRTSLIDLSGRNRLLNFRHTRASTLEVTAPGLLEVVSGLAKGWSFAPLPDEIEAESDAPEDTTVPADGPSGALARKTPATARNSETPRMLKDS